MQFFQAFANVGATRVGSELKSGQAGNLDGEADSVMPLDGFALALEDLSKRIAAESDHTVDSQGVIVETAAHDSEQSVELKLDEPNISRPSPPVIDKKIGLSQSDDSTSLSAKTPVDNAEAERGGSALIPGTEKIKAQSLASDQNSVDINLFGRLEPIQAQPAGFPLHQADQTVQMMDKNGLGVPVLTGDMTRAAMPLAQNTPQASAQNVDHNPQSGLSLMHEVKPALEAQIWERMKGENGATTRADGSFLTKSAVADSSVERIAENLLQKNPENVRTDRADRYAQPTLSMGRASGATALSVTNTASQTSIGLVPAESNSFITAGQETAVFREEFFATSPVEVGHQTTKSLQMGRAYVDLPRQISAQLLDVMRASPDKPVELQLHPEELGRVRLTFQVDASSLNVVLQMERPETLELLRRHIELLAQDMREIGYDEVSFSFQQGEGMLDDSSKRAEHGHEMQGSQKEVMAEAETALLQLSVNKTDRMDIRV